MKNIFTVVCAILLLSACAPRFAWSHRYKTEQDFYRENSQCLAMASSGGPATQIIAKGRGPISQGVIDGINARSARDARVTQQTIYQQCMMGKGWYPVSE